MSELEELRTIIFNMLNFTNMYCLVLDRDMNIKFVNTSLSLDLGYNSYKELLDRCWLDFIIEEEKEMVSIIHTSVANGLDNWEKKYREVQGSMINKDGKLIYAYWFNSHINSQYNCTFSFGIKKSEVEKEEDIRDFYYDIIKKDRVIINSMRDSLHLRDKIVDTCKTTFIDDARISVG